MLKQAHVYIEGYVILVGFRAWTKYQADKYGIKGWVKNSGNRVEALIQADLEVLEAFIEKLKAGAPASQVDKVVVTWQPLDEIYEKGFSLL